MKRFFALILCVVMSMTGCVKSYDEMVGEARGIAYHVIRETDYYMNIKVVDKKSSLESVCEKMKHYEAEMEKLACGTTQSMYGMVSVISSSFYLLSRSKTQEEKDKNLEYIMKARNALAEMSGYPEK